MKKVDLTKIRPVFNFLKREVREEYKKILVTDRDFIFHNHELKVTIKDTFNIKQGVYNCETVGLLSTPEPVDAPDLSRYDDLGRITFRCTATVKELEYLMKFVSKDETRINLNTICFDADLEVMVATDGHRLAYKNLVSPQKNSKIEKSTYLISRDSLTTLIKLLKKYKQEYIILAFSETHVAVDNHNFNFISRLVGREYVRWKVLIPQKLGKPIFLENLPGLKTLKPVLNKNNFGVRLVSKGNDLIMASTITDYSGVVSEVKDKMEFGVNYKYLTDCAEKGQVMLEYFNEAAPLKFKTKNFQGLVMPLRI